MALGVGETLREARTRRKLTLAQVEAETKIRGRYLRAIENEEWDLLPGETYARAFVRTYADFLSLDGSRLAEEHRRERGTVRPGERLPRAEPVRPRAVRSGRRLRVPPRALAALVSVALVVALAAIGLSSGGSDQPQSQQHKGTGREAVTAPEQSTRRHRGLTVSLLATAEVWVCLLDATGEPLIDGQILATGSQEGPYRSGTFTVSFGNGEVEMTVNGQQQSIPETASPVGFSIGRDGSLRELSEGERPTCT
jgi:cytoskeleton protein RodZ